MQSEGDVAGHVDTHANPDALAVGAHAEDGPVHVVPQPPQFGLCERSAAQPAPASTQSAKPGAHWYTHRPPTQATLVVNTLGSEAQS